MVYVYGQRLGKFDSVPSGFSYDPGLPGDSQLMSFHLHARFWFSRLFSWPLIEDMDVWFMHELS